MLSVVGLEKVATNEDPVVIPIGKRSTQRRKKEEMVQVPVRRRERATRVKM